MADVRYWWDKVISLNTYNEYLSWSQWYHLWWWWWFEVVSLCDACHGDYDVNHEDSDGKWLSIWGMPRDGDLNSKSYMLKIYGSKIRLKNWIGGDFRFLLFSFIRYGLDLVLLVLFYANGILLSMIEVKKFIFILSFFSYYLHISKH